ncbi:MAG: M12 family metallopeptidase [Aeromicrobium sp.]
MTDQEGQEQPVDLTEGQIGTALFPGNTFIAKALTYRVLDGLAMFEGDIVLGTLEEVEQQNEQLKEAMSGTTASSVVLAGAQFRWPGGVIPHRVDPALPDQQRVTDAIAHWEANTNYRFPVRTSEPNFVTFRPGPGCSANIGRRGGEQFVNLGPGCTAGNTIHEMGHTVGMWHEQSREDRDLFVTIHFENILPGAETEFLQHIVDGDDVGAYDYGSIMHYPRNAFSIDRATKDTIVPKDASAQIGQRSALSPGDIAAANSLISGTAPTPPTPPGPPPPGPGPLPVPPAFPGRLIKFPPIMSGPDVATWQARMNERGFNLTVDGKYGPLSKAACVDLQNQKGLSADGIVGPLTWAATFGP